MKVQKTADPKIAPPPNKNGAGKASAPHKRSQEPNAPEPDPRELDPQANELANDILSNSRSALMVGFRFLDRALWKMPFSHDPTVERLGNNGKQLFFAALPIIERYTQTPNEVTRDLLHSIFHCIFHHPFPAENIDEGRWDLACDIAIEASIIEFAGSRYPSGLDDWRTPFLDTLHDQIGPLVAEKIYRHLTDNPLTDEAVTASLFHRDDHALWYSHEKKKQQDEDSLTSDEDESDESDEQPDKSDDQQNDQQNDQPEDEQNKDDNQDEQQDDWEEISKRMQMDLESYSQKWGEAGGALMLNIAVANREKHDYAAFLRRFAVLGERMQIDPDEFDLIFYTYGLKLYGNLPLIEPLEYKEDRLIREFVIAIDTSGSCSGDLVKAFITKTFDILKSSENFQEVLNIHIIQCDAKIQDDIKITSTRDLDAYIENFTVKGYGGTNFSPVFEHVDELIARGEFHNLRGLIYFTDGYGTFPHKVPSYDTVFVFLDENFNSPEVPPWAMKIFLDASELDES